MWKFRSRTPRCHQSDVSNISLILYQGIDKTRFSTNMSVFWGLSTAQHQNIFSVKHNELNNIRVNHLTSTAV
jgi:hypothetical protein